MQLWETALREHYGGDRAGAAITPHCKKQQAAFCTSRPCTPALLAAHPDLDRTKGERMHASLALVSFSTSGVFPAVQTSWELSRDSWVHADPVRLVETDFLSKAMLGMIYWWRIWDFSRVFTEHSGPLFEHEIASCLLIGVHSTAPGVGPNPQ